MKIYYNEWDRTAAAWLRELMAEGLIPKGDIDERSITDVRADDLRGYQQCHFFAGIGGWPFALQLADWGERAVWTGSCPCQPFSCAGKRQGHADERHLWPAFYELIAECKPATVFGEQVAGKDSREWLSGVRADLEGAGYAVGAADLCAAGVSAPHRRQRLFWVANSTDTNGRRREHRAQAGTRQEWGRGPSGGSTGSMADAQRDGGRSDESRRGSEGREADGGNGEDVRMANSTQRGLGADGGASGQSGHTKQREQDGVTLGDAGGLGHAASNGLREPQHAGAMVCPPEVQSQYERINGPDGSLCSEPTGFWSDSIFHPCRDGKGRRIPRAQPVFQRLADGFPDDLDVLRAAVGFPLANKIKGRASLLKGYGNAIVPQVAAEFVRAVMAL